MKGFVLAEIIIVISIIAIFTTLTITGFSTFEKYFLSRSAEVEVRTILDRTRNLAIYMYENDGWSFRFQNGEALIFKGNDFDNRDTNFDEFYEISKKVLATTTSDIYFQPLTGHSSSSTVSISTGTSTKNIIVSDYGTIR